MLQKDKVLSVKKLSKVSKTEKLRYLFLAIFWTSVPKIYSCRRDWTLGCLPMKFWDLSNVSIRLNLSKMGSSEHFVKPAKSQGSSYRKASMWRTIVVTDTIFWHRVKSWENKSKLLLDFQIVLFDRLIYFYSYFSYLIVTFSDSFLVSFSSSKSH